MIVKQYFEVLHNDVHKGLPVLIKTQTDRGRYWENWDAKIYHIESDGMVVVEIGKNGVIIRCDRDAVKLLR